MKILWVLALGLGVSPGERILEATKEFQAKNDKQAFAILELLIQEQPMLPDAYRVRARFLEARDRFGEALPDLDKVVELQPRNADAHFHRGLVRFKAGNIEGSIQDFDKQIELNPASKISHWQRGISYYYAGKFKEGMEQFEGYQEFDSNDVENAVWRFMCQVRKEGLDRARKDMLKIGNDRRVPMRQVYDLYAGMLKPEEVLAAAKGNQAGGEQLHRQLFYAHLYLGIYHDLLGDKKRALDHLNRATDEHRIGHYMWDVARVHRDLLKK